MMYKERYDDGFKSKCLALVSPGILPGETYISKSDFLFYTGIYLELNQSALFTMK